MKESIEKLEMLIEELNNELEHIMYAIKRAATINDLDGFQYWYSKLIITLFQTKEEIINADRPQF